MFDRINQAIARTGLKLISRSGAFDASELKESTTVLTNAQVVALRATPVTVVAAPGAGKFAEFVSALLVFNRTAAYTAGAGDDLRGAERHGGWRAVERVDRPAQQWRRGVRRRERGEHGQGRGDVPRPRHGAL